MRIAVLVGFILILARTGTQPPPAIGEEFSLHIGESTEVGEAGLVISFDELLHDSRCPELVTCVWEGVAEMLITAGTPSTPAVQLQLYTETSLPQEFPTSLTYISNQHLIPILRRPNQVVFAIPDGMASSFVIFHSFRISHAPIRASVA